MVEMGNTSLMLLMFQWIEARTQQMEERNQTPEELRTAAEDRGRGDMRRMLQDLRTGRTPAVGSTSTDRK